MNAGASKPKPSSVEVGQLWRFYGTQGTVTHLVLQIIDGLGHPVPPDTPVPAFAYLAMNLECHMEFGFAPTARMLQKNEWEFVSGALT